MNITINPLLRAYIDPLTANEFAALESSILTEGCRDALVLWGEVLIDGHNRYTICQRHGVEFKTVQNTRFSSIEDVMLWMIDNHLARRSVSDFQRGVLALRKKEIVAARLKLSERHSEEKNPPGDTSPEPAPRQSREELAKVAGISSNAISQIEKIQRAATPELVAAVRSGTISINAAATIASLPSEQQVAAVAGGRKELQLAAKQVRDQKSTNLSSKKVVPTKNIENNNDAESDLPTEINDLNKKISALTIENIALKEKITELSLALQAEKMER